MGNLLEIFLQSRRSTVKLTVVKTDLFPLERKMYRGNHTWSMKYHLQEKHDLLLYNQTKNNLTFFIKWNKKVMSYFKGGWVGSVKFSH